LGKTQRRGGGANTVAALFMLNLCRTFRTATTRIALRFTAFLTLLERIVPSTLRAEKVNFTLLQFQLRML
jgi:hypothetical protein